MRIFLLFLILAVSSVAAAEEFPGKKSEWTGFDKFDFDFNGRKAIIVAPSEAAVGKPWIWRARFFGHEPQTDIALLKRGYHVAYCDIGGLFGAPQAVEIWNSFHAEVTTKYGFAQKVALEGMSRGGLIIFNWAKANPDKVTCIYADAPVCDIRSWPGGKGEGKGSPKSWEQCLKVWGLTDTESTDFKGNPIDGLKPLVDAGVPLLHVVGEADDVVPVSENTEILEARYKELGGEIEVIRKPGVGHHPHSLKDPKRIVDFILKSQ